MALAALTTGGTFSDRGGGSAVGATRLSLVGVLEVGVVVVTARDVDVGAAVLDVEPDWLFSAAWNSWRRTGSGPDWNLEVTAGVFRKAPGTGRTGVVCGNDMMGSNIETRAGPLQLQRCRAIPLDAGREPPCKDDGIARVGGWQSKPRIRKSRFWPRRSSSCRSRRRPA